LRKELPREKSFMAATSIPNAILLCGINPWEKNAPSAIVCWLKPKGNKSNAPAKNAITLNNK